MLQFLGARQFLVPIHIIRRLFVLRPFAADQEMPVAKHTHCQLGKRTLPVETAVCNRELVYPNDGDMTGVNVKFCWFCYVPHCDQCGVCV